MAQPKNQDEYRRSFPRPWSEQFGETAEDPELFTDRQPGSTRSAAQHAARVEQRRKGAAKARRQFAEQLRKEQEDREQDPLRGIPTAEIIARAALNQPAQDR
jgi:hypothetical protein